eukprot:SAG22_NODE_15736_length_342_cov_0.641975_1_plen_70_part_01
MVLAFPWYSYVWVVDKSCSGNGTCPLATERTDIGVGQTPNFPEFTCPGGYFTPQPGFYFPPNTCPTCVPP